METPVQSRRVATDTRLWPPRTAQDRAAYSVIIGAGVICFVLLAWVHLGLGALLFPPTATAQQQVARAGDYSVTLQLTSGQLTADGPNTVMLTLRDASAAPLTGATVRVQSVMTTMAMYAPQLTATAQSAGVYTIHPVFGMAGTWRLDVTLTPTGGAAQTTSFNVNVRWS